MPANRYGRAVCDRLMSGIATPSIVASACRTLLTARARRRQRSTRTGTLRILYLLETGGPGGAERMLLDLAANMGSGWQAVIGVMKAGWLRAQALSAALPCVMVGDNGRPDREILKRLVETVEAEDIAVLHAHEFYMSMIGTVVSALTGIPLVVTIHGKSYYPDKRRRRVACRVMARRAAALMVVSNDLRRFFCKTIGTPLDRVRVIHNGIDLRGHSAPRHRNLELLESVSIPRDAKIVGAVGNLYPVKGHLDLIRAAKTIVAQRPTTHVVIFGRGALHDDLVAQAEALGIRKHVHLLGYRDDVKEWLGALDVFTMPSRSEGMPLSLLEAMAAGAPPVVTRVGGMPEVVKDGENGFMVPPGDVAALADRLAVLLDNPDLAARMGTAARSHIVDHFSVERMAGEYRAVYRQVTAASLA